MIYSTTKRPRDVSMFRSAAILYGDWGTSKAYVIGLAFALAGYSSFWYILAVSILSALVALNYVTICKFYPSGGGVYASVRKRSKILSLIGAFFLIADYLVTASLSAVSSFHYLEVPHPEIWACSAIFFIGLLNYLGPKHTGGIAVLISIPTVIVVVLLGFLVLSNLNEAVANTHWITAPPFKAWENFVGIIVALSGIEAIANTTGVMKLNPGSTEANPCVTRTSTPAILMVMIEVCFFTTLFGLAMNALPGLQIANGEVNAPGEPNVRDAMLRYMGEVFATKAFGPQIGYVFGWIVSFVFCILLLSAVNTALVGLSSLLYVLSRDGEVPYFFQRLNRFGVPVMTLALATFLPIVLVLFVNDVAGLADLYAVGFVGAIATNLGATSTNYKLEMNFFERHLMLFTFLLMAAIELTLFWDKPEARGFVFSLVTIGLILRSFVQEQRKVKKDQRELPKPFTSPEIRDLGEGGMLCAINEIGSTLAFALEECKLHKIPLYILYVREQKVITEEDRERTWLTDKGACRIFDYAIEFCHDYPISFLYAVSDSTPYTIVEIAKNKKISRLILGASRRMPLYRLLRGNLIRDISHILPREIDLVVIY
jgi:amino acid transporter